MTQRKLYFHRLRMYTLTPNSEGSEQKYFDISKEKEILVREVQLVNNPLSYSIDFDFNAIAATDYDETISKRIQSEYEQHIDEINELYS